MALESRPAVADEPVTHMRRRLIPAFGVRCSGEGDGSFGDTELIARRTPSQFLDGMPVAVARSDVHRRIGANGVPSKHSFDRARALEESVPVESADGTHAGDRIPDRYLIGGQPE